MPEDDRPPHNSVHVCYVLLFFPIEPQPWSSLLGWARQAVHPLPKGSWIECSGRVLGVLNPELIQGPQVIDSTVRTLVIIPDDWEFIRQSALSIHNTSTPLPLRSLPGYDLMSLTITDDIPHWGPHIRPLYQPCGLVCYKAVELYSSRFANNSKPDLNSCHCSSLGTSRM